jgi:hypothetical protein
MRLFIPVCLGDQDRHQARFESAIAGAGVGFFFYENKN